MPRMKKQPHPKAQPQAAYDDDMPEDMDAFRLDLARRINRFVADRTECWKRCPQSECRRARSCRSPEIECLTIRLEREMSEADGGGARCPACGGRVLARHGDGEADGNDQQS